MTVYIEYVLIDNFVIDFLLLKTTFSITGISYNKFRLCCCSLIGAIFALCYPIISVSQIITILVKILFGCMLLGISNKFETFRNYYINLGVFNGLTFLTGGAIIGIFSILQIDYSSEISIAIMILPAFFLIKAIASLIKTLYRQKHVMACIYKTELILNGTIVKVNGFLDTGNNLYYKDQPITIISKSVFNQLVKDKFPKMEYLSFGTVLGRGKMPCFNIDELRIYISDKPNILFNVRVGVSSNGIGASYSIILHPALTGGFYVESDCEQTKKIS